MRESVKPRRGTSTSTFGTSKRESHDASPFYERFTAPALSRDATVAPRKDIDRIFCGSSAAMDDIDDASVALVVTSPPYFAGKEYETALGEGHVPGSYAEYLEMLEAVFAECVRTLEPGGRIAVNVANLGRKPYRSLSSDIVWILQDRLRLLLRGEVVWIKAKGAGGSCAWGSFQRPANPVLRDLTERVVIASKGRFDRALSAKQRFAKGLPSEASISRDEFMEATTDIWEIPPESASRVGHPAPFPVELPERLIHLYTYRDDLVLDPFMGSGTTAVAAVRTDRHFAGYDTDPAYVDKATARVETERARLAAVASPLVRVALSIGSGVDDDSDLLSRSLREGRAARDLARQTIEEAGFTDVETDVSFPEGVDVSFRALDRRGSVWLFDVSGGFTSSRPGLRRTDVLWKALAKAAVLGVSQPEVPLVLLTTDVPPRSSAAAASLKALVGPERPIHEVLVLGSGAELARLQTLARGATAR